MRSLPQTLCDIALDATPKYYQPHNGPSNTGRRHMIPRRVIYDLRSRAWGPKRQTV